MGTLRLEIRRSFLLASARIWNSLSAAAVRPETELVLGLEVSERVYAMGLPVTGWELSSSPLSLCNCRTFSQQLCS